MAGPKNRVSPSRPEGARITVALIGAAHGIKGEVRVKPLTDDPAAIRGYGPLTSADGRVFEIEAMRPAAGSSPDMLVVRFKGIATRDAAEALTGLELSIQRDKLPATEPDEFYHADLVGLDVVSLDGKTLGTVVALHNFGAGDLIEIAPPTGATLLIPFTEAAVPEIDIAASRIVVIPPADLADDAEEQP
jgi:16S rRNA processing protein RimM